MEGYIKSLAAGWKHIFKRAVRPGGKIPLSELYETYGKKYNIKPGDDFITWLKDVKLSGQQSDWEFVLLDDTPPDNILDDKKSIALDNSGITPEVFSKHAMTVEDVVNLSVRKAREVVPTITDIRLLKYALQEARPRANKESLCRILEKRISMLRVDSRR
jgi:hypothetical protein